MDTKPLSKTVNGIVKACADGGLNEIRNVAEGKTQQSVATVSQLVYRCVRVTLDANTINPQPITLIGGTKFNVIDFRIIKPSVVLNVAAGLNFIDDVFPSPIFCGSGDSTLLGETLASLDVAGNISFSFAYINILRIAKNAGMVALYPDPTIWNLYAQFTTPQGAPATVDCIITYMVIA